MEFKDFLAIALTIIAALLAVGGFICSIAFIIDKIKGDITISIGMIIFSFALSLILGLIVFSATQKSIKICEHCNHIELDISYEKDYCPECGAPYPVIEVPIPTCNNCNQQVSLNDKFCPKCGAEQGNG